MWARQASRGESSSWHGVIMCNSVDVDLEHKFLQSKGIVNSTATSTLICTVISIRCKVNVRDGRGDTCQQGISAVSIHDPHLVPAMLKCTKLPSPTSFRGLQQLPLLVCTEVVVEEQQASAFALVSLQETISCLLCAEAEEPICRVLQNL